MDIFAELCRIVLALIKKDVFPKPFRLEETVHSKLMLSIHRGLNLATEGTFVRFSRRLCGDD